MSSRHWRWYIAKEFSISRNLPRWRLNEFRYLLLKQEVGQHFSLECFLTVQTHTCMHIMNNNFCIYLKWRPRPQTGLGAGPTSTLSYRLGTFFKFCISLKRTIKSIQRYGHAQQEMRYFDFFGILWHFLRTFTYLSYTVHRIDLIFCGYELKALKMIYCEGIFHIS